MANEYTCPIRESFAVPPHRGVLYQSIGKVKNGATPGFACKPCLDRLKLAVGAEVDMSKTGPAPYLP
jgi:hypothetical protein